MTAHVATEPLPSPDAVPRRTGPILVASRGRRADPFLAAQLLAARTGADVVVTSVLQLLPLYPLASEFGPLPLDVEQERRQSLHATVQRRLEETLGPDARWPIETDYGPTADAIVRAARAHDAQLIVMGIGQGRLTDRLRDSETTLRVARRAPCPVLAVAGEWRALPRDVVAAVDFSPSSLWAMECALPLLDEAATVHLVHVWERSVETTPDALARDADAAHRATALLERARDAMHVPASVRILPLSLEGPPVRRLVELAASHDVELMVAGRSGHGMIERLFLGSVTTGLLRGAPCSVLVVPEPPLTQVERLARLVHGHFESGLRGAWVVELGAFAKRNHGRRTILEVDDPAIGAQVQESGYALLGATYDVKDGRAELMFGAPEGGTTHLTRSITGVTSVAELTDAQGNDVALRIAHGNGQTLLTFLPAPERGGAL